MAKIKLRPLDDRVVVEPLEAEETTAGGIVLPDTAKEKPQRGKVVAVGPGKLLDSGNRGELSVDGRRRSDLRQVRRHRDRSRRRGVQDPPRERHPGEGRRVNSREQQTSVRSAERRSTDDASDDSRIPTTDSIAYRNSLSWPKQLLFDDARPSQDARGRGEAGRRGRHHAGPDRPQRDHRQVVRRPDRHQGRRHRQQGNRARRPASRTWAPSSSTKSPRRPRDVAGDGTTTATVLARAIFKEGTAQHRRRQQSDGRPPRHREGRRRPRSSSSTRWPSRSPSKEEIAQVGAISANNDRDDRRAAGRRDGEGRQGRRHHGRRRQDDRDDARVRRGHAVRQGLHLALLHQPAGRRWSACWKTRYILIHEKKISNLRELLPMLEKIEPDGQAAVDHRRGRRRRSAGGAGRQQAPRRAERLRREGPRLRRSPQGDAGRHRHADRRHVDQRRPGHEAREHRRSSSWAGPRRSRSTRTTRRSSKAPASTADIQKRIEQIRKQIESTDERVRPGEVPGAAGEADRRRGDHLGRRRHRSRHEAEEGPRRRRPARHACGGRRRHPARRRRGPAALHARRSRRPATSAKGDEKIGVDIVLARARRSAASRSPTTAASTAAWSPTKSARSRRTSATTPTPASTSTCSRPASSTRRRSCSTALRNAASIAGLMLTTEALVTNFDQETRTRRRVVGSIR